MESQRRSVLIIPPGVDPQDFDTIILRPQSQAVVYRCPVCGKCERSEFGGMVEPCCTGPHPSLDEHEMTPMMRVKE